METINEELKRTEKENDENNERIKVCYREPSPEQLPESIATDGSIAIESPPPAQEEARPEAAEASPPPPEIEKEEAEPDILKEKAGIRINQDETPPMEAPLFRIMDRSQISMLASTSPKIKAHITLGAFSGMEIIEGPEAPTIPREPKLAHTAIVTVPLQYLQDFLKLINKAKDAKAHIKIYAATDRPLMLEVEHEGGEKTRFWLAPRIEAD